MPEAKKPPSKRRRIWRWCKRGLLCVLACFLLYGLAAWILGAIAVNRDWVEAKSGVEIYVWSHGVHADFVLPVRTPRIDWRKELPLADPRESLFRSFVAIGWGDHDFYVVTPRWEDLQISTTLKSLFLPTDTVMHVTYYPRTFFEESDSCVKLTLSAVEYDKLVAYILASFERDTSGRPERLDFSYWDADAFFHAKGSYHLFDTCNNWVNSGLKVTGVRTAVWAPFGYAILDHLPKR